MSVFSEKEIDELIKLFQRELGLEVSAKEACRYATQLVNLLRITYKDELDVSNNSPPYKT